MRFVCRLLLVAVGAACATQALAEPRYGGRYEMSRLSPSSDRLGHRVLILDKRTGAMWTWSAPATVEYAGQLYPMTAEGSFARVLHVPPHDDR